MKSENASQIQPDDRESPWQKTPDANLIRYAPSGKYFARIRVGGKLIRQSLKTKVLTIAKLKLADLEKPERSKLEGQLKDNSAWWRERHFWGFGKSSAHADFFGGEKKVAKNFCL
jgi:hypothetical protein